MKRILILGGGTGGTIVANLLAKRLKTGEAELTLVSASDRHYFQPGWLYVPFERQETRKLSRPMKRLLHEQVVFLPQEVEELDTQSSRVTLTDGMALHFDYLIIATGSRLISTDHLRSPVRGHHFYTAEAASKLHAALTLFGKGRIAIGVAQLPYKCPPAPLEFAFLLEELLSRTGRRDGAEITYFYPQDGVLPIENAGELAMQLLKAREIRVETSFEAKEWSDDGILISADGRALDCDLLVMIPPHRGAEFLQGHSIADARGWVNTDPATLQVREHPHIWALGDTTNLAVPKAGSAAHFQAPVVVAGVLAALHGTAPDPKHAEYGGHVVSFMETGYGKAALFDFDYQRSAHPGEPSAINHYLKLAFNKAYWHLVPTGVI
jgi:sulfide:quinone oxidoreductase